jgi:hypothetical protein
MRRLGTPQRRFSLSATNQTRLNDTARVSPEKQPLPYCFGVRWPRSSSLPLACGHRRAPFPRGLTGNSEHYYPTTKCPA